MNTLKNKKSKTMLKKIYLLITIFLPNVLFAFDCSQFKYDTDVDIKLKVNDTVIQKSSENLNGKLGYTQPKISYSILSRTVMIPVEGGNCASLRGIDIEIDEDYDITIDKSLKEESCAYNIVYKHEQDHVNVYKNVIKNNIENIRKSISSELQNFEPIFIENNTEMPDYSDKIINNDFVRHTISDIMNKFEIENKKIDERGDSYNIWKCEDFYQEAKNSDIVID